MKERLTGAIILVALVVLLVPELLTGPGPSEQGSHSAANADGAQMRQYTINLADDAAARGSASAPVTAAPTPETSPPESAAQASSSAAAPQPERGAAAGDAASAVSASVESADVGDEQTEQSADELPPAPAVAKADPPPKAAPPRVELPKPEPAKPSAPKAEPVKAEPPRARLAEAPKAAAKAEPSAPAKGGWAWQVGSFASRENAERLARELKGKGFAATVSDSTSKGKRLWRVRVGPEPDRAAAVALGTRLKSAGQSGGAPVPYP